MEWIRSRISGIASLFHRTTEPSITTVLPQDVMELIFARLSPLDLSSCSQVCRDFRVLSRTETDRREAQVETFGKKEWAAHFGDVGSTPALPANILEILESPCPFWPNKIKETHMLVLIPKTVNGKPLTLKSLAELVKAPKEGPASCFSRCSLGFESQELYREAVVQSHWVLMTRDVVPDSRGAHPTLQKNLVEVHEGYAVPKVLEAAACIFMNHVRSGEYLFPGENPSEGKQSGTLSICQERELDLFATLCVGCFSKEGLSIYPDHHRPGGIRRSLTGVAAVCRV